MMHWKKHASIVYLVFVFYSILINRTQKQQEEQAS
jgi:preprotein translocase subunit YajC